MKPPILHRKEPFTRVVMRDLAIIIGSLTALTLFLFLPFNRSANQNNLGALLLFSIVLIPAFFYFLDGMVKAVLGWGMSPVFPTRFGNRNLKPEEAGITGRIALFVWSFLIVCIVSAIFTYLVRQAYF